MLVGAHRLARCCSRRTSYRSLLSGEQPDVSECVVSTVTSGEFHLGNNVVPINRRSRSRWDKSENARARAGDGRKRSRNRADDPWRAARIELLGDLTKSQRQLNSGDGLSEHGQPWRPRRSGVVSLRSWSNSTTPSRNQCIVGSTTEPVSLNLTTGHRPPRRMSDQRKTRNVAILAEGACRLSPKTRWSTMLSRPGSERLRWRSLPLVDPSVNLKAGFRSGWEKHGDHDGGFLQADARIVKTEAELRCRPVHESGRCERRQSTVSAASIELNCVTEAVESSNPASSNGGRPGSHRKFSGTGELTTLETGQKPK